MISMHTEQERRTNNPSAGGKTKEPKQKPIPASLQGRIRAVRQAVFDYVHYTGTVLGAASEKESEDMLKGIEHINPHSEEEVRGWEEFVTGHMQRMRSSAAMLAKELDMMVEKAEAEGVISATSKKKWLLRFRDPMIGYKTKEYFVKTELPRRLLNMREVVRERKILLRNPHLQEITHRDVKDLGMLLDEKKFLSLHFDQRQHLLDMAAAAILARNKYGNELYATAKKKLEKAVKQGALAEHKVGTWLWRMFSARQERKKIQEFIHGKGGKSLDALITSWMSVAKDYDKVEGLYENTKKKPMGFRFVSRKEFLGMHYAQRISFVREARRTLDASKNIKKEEGIILEIRHCLDIRDWEQADTLIRTAQREELKNPEDYARLLSMKQFLAQHRDDGGRGESKSGNEEIKSAHATIEATLRGMDGAMADIVRRLLPAGSQAIRNLRWGVGNYGWCLKNGYINDEKAQRGLLKNRERSAELAKRGEDVGTHDVIQSDDRRQIRRDEYQKKSRKQKATVQYVDLSVEGVRANIAGFYLNREPAVLYWTTFVGCAGPDKAHDSAWHLRQFEALSTICSAMRTIEFAEKKKG